MCIMVKWLFFLTSVIFCHAYKFASLDKIYQKGVDAYSKERWSECIVQFEESLHLYKVYRAVIINCRLKCKSQGHNSEIENIEDLQIFEYFINVRNCLSKCHEQEFENVHMFNNVSDTVLSYFQLKNPYAYLQLCYFQINDLPKAASAAFTYSVAHPDDKDMKNNVNYYIQQSEVDVKEVIDLEIDNYQVSYKLGILAYKENKWAETIKKMEEAISQYISWENSCRAECDRQPEQEWSPEITITVSNNIAAILTCRQKCQDELKPYYDSGVEILADLLNYLQICYYHIDKIDEAAKAVTTYLVLMPNDVDMLDNKNIYNTVTYKENFVARSDIVHYFRRDKYEKQLLSYFHKENDNHSNANSI